MSDPAATIVRSSCWTCGTVDLGVSDVTVLLGHGHAPRYRFSCPLCGEQIVKPTTDEAVRLLREAGTPVLDDSAGPAVPAARAAGVLTEDDLIAFGQALAGTDLLAACAAQAR